MRFHGVFKAALPLAAGMALIVAIAGCKGPGGAGGTGSPVAADRDAGSAGSGGISMDDLAATALPGYVLQRRQLSGPGLGYHYHYKSPSASLLVTVGVFASAAEARAAADLSHALMPDKPRAESGIGDETWVWDKDGASQCASGPAGSCCGSAATCRLTRPGNRPGGCWIIYRPPRRLPRSARPCPGCALRTCRTSWRPTHAWSCAWGSRGRPRATASSWARGHPGGMPRRPGRTGASRSAPGGPARVTVRCYAVFDDNRVAVESHAVDVQP